MFLEHIGSISNKTLQSQTKHLPAKMLKKIGRGRLSSGLCMCWQELGCSILNFRDLQVQMVVVIFLDQIHTWSNAQGLWKLLQEWGNNSSRTIKSLGYVHCGHERWEYKVVVIYLMEKGNFWVSTQIYHADAMACGGLLLLTWTWPWATSCSCNVVCAESGPETLLTKPFGSFWDARSLVLQSDELFEVKSARKVVVAIPRPHGKRINQSFDGLGVQRCCAAREGQS